MEVVRADVHEQRSGIPTYLRRLGVSVEVSALPTADYDLGLGVLVERKRTRDLHLALVNGRFWPQIGKLRRCASWPLLLVEGESLRGPIDLEAIRGVYVAALEQGVGIVRSRNPNDSAAWLRRIAVRVQQRGHRHRPRFAQVPKSPRDQIPAAMLAAVPGISTVTAHALLARFGSVAGLADADENEWLTVAGVGRRRARALAEALHGDPF